MDKSDTQELVVSLYLRLNGYFVSGFIVHSHDRTTTEMDVLAVRFPHHQEPEREVQPCARLEIPDEHIDFLVGEVKGGQGPVNFNAGFRSNPPAITTVLNRFGAFDHAERSRVERTVPRLLDPASLLKAKAFPTLDVATSAVLGSRSAKLRLIPFAAEQRRPNHHSRAYVYADDMLEYIWRCFRPEQRRPLCDDHYNYELWGPYFVELVRHFKD